MRIIIAGGGTGGHLFPGIAVAEEIRHREPAAEILFIGTERGLESTVLPRLGWRLKKIRVGGLVGKSRSETAKNLLLLPLGIMQSFNIVRAFRPDLALGVGGYSAGPAIIAAYLAGVKTAIAEQNAQPGLTNRILGRFADRIFLTYEETVSWFPYPKSLITGNPVRRGFLLAGQQKVKKADGPFTLLFFGGSQGATAINEAVAGALPYWKKNKLNLKIIHQTGKRDWEYIKRLYEESGKQAEVLPFIMDMAPVMSEADLIVCRAGATSLAELTTLGKPAILIPYPHATHNHQMKNARALAQRGAAQVIPEGALDGHSLAKAVEHWYRNPESLSKMAQNALKAGRPDAAADIVDILMTLREGREKK
jgi:UDP-N-acetylglucosamine--N-acetylmuramyl-(pentapeptide) pyrophosphoryl-undecaprenol N-acetylglucosamine transferase